jgi:DNA gyrase subunit A
VVPDDELMLITRNGIVIRQSVNGIRVIGRNTQGVRLINLDAGDVVMDVACMVNEDDIAEAVGESDASESPEGTAEPGDVEELGEGEVQEV